MRRGRNRNALLIVFLTFIVVLGGYGVWMAMQLSTSFDAFSEKHFKEMLRRDVMLQWIVGDPTGFGVPAPKAGLLDLSDEAVNQGYEQASRIAAELKRFDAERLSEQERLSFDVMTHSMQMAQESERWKQHDKTALLEAVLYLPTNMTSYYTFTSESDLTAYLESIESYPQMMDGLVEALESREAAGVPFLRPYLGYIMTELERLYYSDPSKDLYAIRLEEAMAQLELAEEKRQGYRDRIKLALKEKVYASYDKLKACVNDVLFPSAVSGYSLAALPDGKDYYAFLVKVRTGTTMTPEEVHHYAKQRAEVLLQELRQLPDDSPKNWPIFDRLKRIIGLQQEMDAKLPDMFEEHLITTSKLRYQETSLPFSVYRQLSYDQSREGNIFISQQQYFDSVGLKMAAYHEGSPGHHFQLAIQNRSEKIPNYRRVFWHPAYIEGWATYADTTLPREMGLFSGQGELQSSLWMEIGHMMNIVLDTGVHALDWTKEDTERYIKSITGRSINVQMEQFANMPSMILSYGMGYEQFRTLREKAESALGERFDVRSFHTAVLENGSLPYQLLEQQVDRYIAKQSADQSVDQDAA